MIEAKDLKIGDVVSCNGFNVKVGEITYLGLTIVDRNGCTVSVEYSDIEPIPLTPEILKQNGWEQARHIVDEDDFEWYVYSKDDILSDMYYYPTDGKDFSAFVCGQEFCPNIKYVHQLQHLLWALGEDSIIRV